VALTHNSLVLVPAKDRPARIGLWVYVVYPGLALG
jgi:hypothetical protein